jgi:hypothetical protein
MYGRVVVGEAEITSYMCQLQNICQVDNIF